MEPLPPAAGRRLRLVAVATALLVLVAVVAFASRSGFGSGKTAPTRGFSDWAFSMFIVLFVLAIPATLYALFFSGELPDKQSERGLATNVLRNIAIVGVVLFAVAAYYYLRRHHHLNGLHLQVAGGSGAGKGGKHGTQASHPLTFQWPVILVGAGLVVATIAMWVSLRRQRKPYVDVPLSDGANRLAGDVAASITDALDDLEAEPDARRAVVAAYARMETVLARSGLERAASETPVEYLERALLGVTARGDAVRTLTGLFQEARFSSHPIDRDMKRKAIDALSAIRDDLLATA